MTSSIILVDDDRHILTSLEMMLEAEGFTVRSYSDSTEAAAEIAKNPASLAILDIKMPRLNGFELIEKIREKSAMPVIFLTSRDDEEDEMMGFRLGADDFIKKPFSQRLLIERIRAILRRNHASTTDIAAGTLQQGALTLNESRHDCTWKGHPISLTVTEFILLSTLVRALGSVKTRDDLIMAAYNTSTGTDDRTIDSHIRRMRKKFRDHDPLFDNIETLYGAGYRYREA